MLKDINGKLKKKNGLLRDGDATMGMIKLHYEREWGWKKKENASPKKGANDLLQLHKATHELRGTNTISKSGIESNLWKK